MNCAATVGRLKGILSAKHSAVFPWLKKFLAKHFGFRPAWIHTAIVFTNGRVPLHCEVSNLAVIRPSYLERWMAKQAGNAQAAQKLWPQIDKVEAHLFTAPREARNSWNPRNSVAAAAGLAG